MSEENGCEVMETIDEIVREMRIIGSVEEKPTDQIPSSFHAPGLRMFADRIEEAANREREACAYAVQICGENAENETIADIVSEMREFADTDSQTIGRDVLRKRIQDFSRRIEHSVTDCNQFGNAATIREALEALVGVIDECSSGNPLWWHICAKGVKPLKDAREALSEPQRNCDRILAKTLIGAVTLYCSKNPELPPMVEWNSIQYLEFCKWLFSEAKED